MRLLLLLLLGACAKTPRGLYLDALYEHTELGFVSRGFGTALRLRATYLSPEFRVTLADERRRLTDATEEDHARFVAMMTEDAVDWHEVVFTAESDIEPNTRFGDDDSVWKIRLTADGAEEALVTVFRVRDPSALHHSLYAHMNDWNELWIARFARTVAQPAEVVFHVGSGWGHDEVRWTGEQVR